MAMTSQYNRSAEQSLLKAQVDSQSIHEATCRTLREQHRREISCLQDELEDERKRSGHLLLHEKKMRVQAESKEAELRIKCATLTDKIASVEKQFERECAEFRAAKLSWERDRNEGQRAQEARLEKVEEEKDRLVADAQETARKKMEAMTMKFNKSIRDMEVRSAFV